ncbi:MAG TPA: RHS repeat-associated core domain-containing protein [Pyrinomonadaceae bacterium]|nr:RHS repeat-associated core domain-containing protein [Pyrinomonadaceae bacterium]
MTRTLSSLKRFKLNALLIIAAILIVLLPTLASGQGSTPARGFQPGGSYALSDIESINTTNGNLMFNLALGKLAPGRGGFSGQLNLHYDSKLYDSHTQYYQDWDHPIFGEPQTVIRNMLMTSDQGGWHYGTGYELQLIDRLSQYPLEIMPQYPDPATLYHYKVKVAFPDGSLHEFLPRGFGSPMDEGYYGIRPDGWRTQFNGSYTTDVPYLTSTLNYYTFDGTYIRLEVQHDSDGNWWNNPWTLYFPDGTKVTNFGTRITDRNGNYVEFSNVTYNGHPATQLIDQLGRKIILEFQGVSDGEIIHVPGVGGVDVTYQIHWKGLQVYKPYATDDPGKYDENGYPDVLGYQFVVARIDLPAATGGLQYLFGYNAADLGSSPCCTPSYGWGELSSVTLPSGAQAQYQYQLDGQNGSLWSDVLKNSVSRKSLTYQQQYDGSSTPVTETWNYTVETGIATIVMPDGGVVTENYDGKTKVRTVNADGSVSEKIWQANRPQGFASTYAPDPATGIDAYDPQGANAFVKTEFTSIRDVNGTLTKTAIKDYNYDKNGNVTVVKEYDWVDYSSVSRNGMGLPTAIPGSAVLKRVTSTTYANSTPDASDTSTNDADSYWNSTSPAVKGLAASSEVSNGSTTLTRSEFYYDNTATTGNLTQQKQWDSTKGAYSNPLTGTNSISTSTTYNQYGSPTLTTDARGVQTQFVYGSVGGFTDLYPTQVKTAYQTAVQRTETREYDFSTAAVTRATDVDNNVATATTYDVLGRPTLVKSAEGKTQETRTATEYSDVNRRVIVRSDQTTLGDGKLVSIQHYDQLGRIRLSRQLEDSANQSATDETTGVKVQTRYVVSNPCQPASTDTCLAANSSVLGSYQLVSNPYRASTSSAASSEGTMGWSRTRNDKGGRTIAVESFSGATLPAPWGANSSSTGAMVTSYDANTTTVMDQTSKVRRSIMDGLGRLSRVDEPNSSGSLGSVSTPNQATSYTYDALDNLTTVSQGSQTRTFVYSSLRRLTSANNPESGTITYGYDNNGNMTSRVDPRSITTNFAYDSLSRITSRTYSDGTPNLTFVYDDAGVANSKGRLTSISTSVSTSNTTAYDVLGRISSANQVTDGQTYAMSYTYNLAGALTSLTYPSGRINSFEYDTAGRLAGVRDQQSGSYYAGAAGTDTNRIKYAAHGVVSIVKLGNNLWEHTDFNSRLQSTEIGLGTTSTDSSTLRLTYSYGTTTNNGNLQSVSYLGGGLSYTQSFGYDELNRLTTSSESTGGWSQTNKYDRYGNRAIDLGGGNQSLYFNTSNRITNSGYTYDAAGNLTNDSTQSFGYDADNKIKSVNGVSDVYRYDGQGNRVRKNFSTGEKVRMVYSGGQLIAEYDLNTGSLKKEYVYGPKGLLATVEPGTGTRYTTSDHLGSPRVVTNSSAGVVSRHDYMPFGEEIGSGVGGRTSGMGFSVADGVRQKFTQKERDLETGLDYFLARYYSSTQGRFTSVDPSGRSIKSSNPQTWNRYIYTSNNPLVYIDPNGKWPAPTHDRIIEKAFDTMDKGMLYAIKQGSRHVDLKGANPRTLWEANAAQHAMTAGTLVHKYGLQTAQSIARRDAINFIETSLSSAKNLYDQASRTRTGFDGSLEAFGNAMHTIMDNWSPQHRDFKVYDNKPYWDMTAFLPGGAAVLYGFDMFIHAQGESRDPNDDEMNHMIDEMRLRFYEVYGEDVYNRVVSQAEREKTAERLSLMRLDQLLYCVGAEPRKGFEK